MAEINDNEIEAALAECVDREYNRLYKCYSCNKEEKDPYCTCHECDKSACEVCSESGSMIWIAVPWINDSKLPVSFCINCKKNLTHE